MIDQISEGDSNKENYIYAPSTSVYNDRSIQSLQPSTPTQIIQKNLSKNNEMSYPKVVNSSLNKGF